MWSIALLVLTSIAGCGKKGNVAPVHGKVLLDGQPLTKGTVGTLPAAGRGANAVIQSDGSFSLRTFGKDDGASIGPHKVCVAAWEGTGGKGPEAAYGKALVPQRYMNPETSGLTIDVPPEGKNDVVLNLTSAAEPKK
jgi:hypothetical protein